MVLFDLLMEDANNANAGMYVSRSACFGGEELLRSTTKRTAVRMNRMTGKGYSKVNPKVSTGLDSENAQPRMAVTGSLNPNSGIPNSGRVNTNLGGNSEYPSLVKHSNIPGNDGSRPGFDSDGTRNASSVLVNMHTPSPVDKVLIHSTDDVAALFSVPLNSLKEIDDFTKDLEVGKHDLWLELTKEACSGIINIISNLLNMPTGALIVDDSLSGKVSPNDPIVQAVDINTKSTSYSRAAGASAKDQPKVNSNFCPLVADLVFDGVKNNWVKHGLKRIMMNTKGFFFFKFDSRAGLEAVFECGPWLIQDGISLIATFIRKPVMLDSYTSSMCNDSWGRSIFARCLVEVNSKVDLVDVVTIGISSLMGDGFTKEKIPLSMNGGCPGVIFIRYLVLFMTISLRKGKSKSNNGGQFVGPLVKRNVRYEPKATNSEPKKGATNVGNASKSSSMLKSTGTSSKKDNITMSNSYYALENEEEEDEEHVENMYDESANLFPNSKTCESSSFTAAAG
ncbi:hypothetical protein Tco_1575246 [Tanacetum coccineum]